MRNWFFLAAMFLTVGCYDYSSESTAITCDVGDGACTVCTDSDCSDPITVQIPPTPIMDRCDPATFKTNQLVGSCWTEQCINNEKTLVPKIAGVNCVFRPLGAPNDEFVIGVCGEFGTCGK